MNKKKSFDKRSIFIVFVLQIVLINASNYRDLKCQFCANNIKGRYIIQEKKVYHEICYRDHVQLRCDYCSDIINDSYNIDREKKYHKSCYRENILEKCDVCFQPIDSEYVKDHYNNLYHNSHRSSMPSCESCNRLICKSITNGGYSINNQRNICNICWEFVVNEASLIDHIYNELRMEFFNIGIENIPNSIPIILIDDKEELNRIAGIRLSDGIQGYTKYDYQTIGKKIINERFNIYILSNLHELNFRAVLAHELLHVYLFNNKIQMKDSLIEGFCNLGSEYIYNSNKDDKMSQLKLKSMFKNNHPEYGEGFRIMSAELKNNGWRNLLDNLENY